MVVCRVEDHERGEVQYSGQKRKLHIFRSKVRTKILVAAFLHAIRSEWLESRYVLYFHLRIGLL